ncbi:MAG TPA: GNAT family N-acetyltransferase [Atribacteraceae bacterium]|nr:GNAT family N-acetyltransferase [Atribacteraceae bacterium]
MSSDSGYLILKNSRTIAARLFMFLLGGKDLVTFCVYLDETDRVLGMTGLYRYKKDADEAVWLSWFCVAPEVRSRGIGQSLIEHTEKIARGKGFHTIRLYTSTDPNEAAAQRFYEKNGYREISRKKGRCGSMIFREKRL